MPGQSKHNPYLKQPNERARLGKRTLVARVTGTAATGESAPFAWVADPAPPAAAAAEPTEPAAPDTILGQKAPAAIDETMDDVKTSQHNVDQVAVTTSSPTAEQEEKQPAPVAAATATAAEDDAPPAGRPTAPHSHVSSLEAPFALDVSDAAEAKVNDCDPIERKGKRMALAKPSMTDNKVADAAPAAGMRSTSTHAPSQKAHIAPPESVAPFATASSAEESSKPLQQQHNHNHNKVGGGAADEAPPAGRSSVAFKASHKAHTVPPEVAAMARSAPWDTSWQPSPEPRRQKRKQQQQQQPPSDSLPPQAQPVAQPPIQQQQQEQAAGRPAPRSTHQSTPTCTELLPTCTGNTRRARALPPNSPRTYPVRTNASPPSTGLTILAGARRRDLKPCWLATNAC